MDPDKNRQQEVLEKKLRDVLATVNDASGAMKYPAEYLKFKKDIIVPHLRIALDRFKRGVQDICIDCGKEIPAERLEKIPAAIRCARCQTRFEKGGGPSGKERKEAAIFEAYREARLKLKPKLSASQDEFDNAAYEVWSEATHKIVDCPCRVGHPELCIERLSKEEKIDMLRGTVLGFDRFLDLIAVAKQIAQAIASR
ncbi:TraR/DksA C4-type zinc finger protein [Patescibacteria group bacterium]|nr:TraR/DksA C4-type zinc finger protein [Patescibacteria group bacterium]